MTRLLLLLAVVASLGANVLLALRRPAAPPPASASAARAAARTALVRDEISPETWQRLASDDLPTLIERLQAEQFPPGLLRTIVEAQVREHHAPRVRAVAMQLRAKPYWQLRFRDYHSDPAAEAVLRDIERDVAETLRALLGPIPDERSETRRRLERRQYGDLSADKIAAIERLDRDYEEMSNQVAAAADGFLLPEDFARREFLDRERRADLVQLLTPEELLAYDLRRSPAAFQLRARLLGFDATEEEFRTLFALSPALNDFYNRSGSQFRTPEREAEQRSLEKNREPLIAAALGPERYADYQRVNDPAWRGSRSFVEHLNLPAETTPKLYAIRREIARRAQAVREDAALAPDQRAAQLRGLAQEAERQLGTVLDAGNVARYRSFTPDWFDALVQPPTPDDPAR